MVFKKVQKSDISTISEEVFTSVTSHTALFLSGGSTPKDLYSYWATQERLDVGCVGMVDERYVAPDAIGSDKDNSNERMMRETGLVEALEKQEIPFYPMLAGSSAVISKRSEKSHGNLSDTPRDDKILSSSDLETTAQKYDVLLKNLFIQFQNKVGILGIGKDGHIAGIPPLLELGDRNYESGEPHSLFNDPNSLVISYDIPELHAQGFGPRLTMTYAALSQMDHLFLLAFGEEKKWALSEMMKTGSLEELPARFLARPEITDRVTVFTDQSWNNEE